MKIGFDAKRLFNNFTGIGNFSRTFLEALATHHPNEQYFLYSPTQRNNNITAPFINSEKYSVKLPTNILVRGSLWRTFGISSLVKKDNIDLYHGLSNELPIGLDIPSIVTIHDVAFKCFKNMYSQANRAIYDAKWKHACRVATHIIAISQSTKNDIVRYYNVEPERIDVVYQPVAPQYYETPSPQPEKLPVTTPYMLYVGTINSRKNLLGLVKAIHHLPSDLLIPLIVVGEGSDYKRQVMRFVAENNMERHVIFPQKRVSDVDLQQLYLNAQLFVYPSFYEGFGIPVVEAMLCGCPVVTSNISSLPEAAGPNSLLVDPTNIDDIKQKIISGLTDTNLRETMKETGREYALKNFSPKACVDSHINLYRKILKITS